MKYHFFTITLDDLTHDNVLSQINAWLLTKNQHYIVTPNPEMIMLARRDTFFQRALTRADIALVDGIGLEWATTILGHKIKRVTGSDLLMGLLQRAPQGTKFYFLGGEDEISNKAALIAKQKYGAEVVGQLEPPRGTYDFANKIIVGNENWHKKIIGDINRASPDILIVALGHNQQEKWMAEFLSACSSVKVAIGVGGALDYLGDKIKRAPLLFRALGLEWLWRLFRQPKRWRRIKTAVIDFSLETLRWYWSKKFLYRPCVSACVVNSSGDILLVERLDEKGHWQFPQGGREKGESVIEAITRELKEEIGTDKFVILGHTSKPIYRYDWPKNAIEAIQRSAVSRYNTYRGQKVTLVYLRFLGNDNDIIVDNLEHTAWQWVKQGDLLKIIHPKRVNLAKICLNEMDKYVK